MSRISDQCEVYFFGYGFETGLVQKQNASMMIEELQVLNVDE